MLPCCTMSYTRNDGTEVVQMMVWLPKHLKLLTQARAKADNRSLSAYIRMAIEEKMAREKLSDATTLT